MKKVFAVMSSLLLTIAFVGLLSTRVNAAGALFTDPYEAGALEEDEDPMFIMDSIYTTFPQYYDYASAPDAAWAGAARMYPWNETKLRVAQLDENGVATGRYYAIFFSGGLKATDAGAGNNIMFLDAEVAEDGTVTPVSKRTSTYAEEGWELADNPMDQSLSHMAQNVSEYDLEYRPTKFYVSNSAATGYGSQIMNRSIIFDGEGRAIRGVGINEFYVAEDDASYRGYAFAPEFCYVDGVVTKLADGVVCDKVKEPVYEEDGVTPKLDPETGEPMMQETDKDHYLNERFVWEWFEEQPENVNTVPYLSAGWDPTKWDYCWPQDEGYMCIAFNGSAGTLDSMTGAQKEAYLANNGITTDENGVMTDAAGNVVEALPIRECISYIRVPAGGVIYDFGYLDNGKEIQTAGFFNILYGGYKYGRQAMAQVKTVNFSSKPIYIADKVINGQSLQVREDANIIEVLEGTTIKPSDLFNYAGLAKMFTVQDDITSYTSDTSVLDVNVYLDGTKVASSAVTWKYSNSTVQEMMRDFFEDLRHWYIGDLTIEGHVDENGEPIVLGYSGGNSYFLDTNDDGKKDTDFTTDLDTFITKWTSSIVDSWGLFNNGNSTSATGFLNQAPVQQKWELLLTYMNNLMGGTFWSSAYTSYARIRDYYKGTVSSFPNPSAGAKPDQTPKAYNDVEYNFVAGAPKSRSVVTYEVTNSTTGLVDKLSVTFLTVVEYTPIVVINEDALYVYPEEFDGKKVIDPIDPYTLFTAYDGAYCAATGDIRGTVITENAVVTSETLDFANPVEGNHLVRIEVSSLNGTRKTVKHVTVQVLDVTAPTLIVVPTMRLAYGARFNVTDAIVLAADAVDGNLFDLEGMWWSDGSSTPVDTKKPGEYPVVLYVYDKSGNEASATFTVYVDELGLSEKAFNETIEGAISQIEDITLQLEEVTSYVAPSGCKSKKLFFVEFLAAAGILALVLRKKH